MTRCDMYVWTVTQFHIRLRQGVCSVLTYGSEPCNLTSDVQRVRESSVINGAKNRMASIAARQTQKEDTTCTAAGTSSFDIVRAVRARRLQVLVQVAGANPADGLRPSPDKDRATRV